MCRVSLLISWSPYSWGGGSGWKRARTGLVTLGPKAGTPHAQPKSNTAASTYFLPEGWGEGEGHPGAPAQLALGKRTPPVPRPPSFLLLQPTSGLSHCCLWGWPLRTLPGHLSPQIPTFPRPNPVAIRANPLGGIPLGKPGRVGPALRGRGHLV